MAKYKIAFSGFAYVEADSFVAAGELFENDEVDYMETQLDSIEEVDEFLVRL